MINSARRVGALSANLIAEKAPTPTLPRKRERGLTAVVLYRSLKPIDG
jgi:hypothetical protein